MGVGGGWVAVRWSTRCWVLLVNPVSPLMGGGSEGEAAGVAIWNVMGWGCEWGVGRGWWGLGSHLVVDETLGASRQPRFPLDGGWKRG